MTNDNDDINLIDYLEITYSTLIPQHYYKYNFLST